MSPSASPETKVPVKKPAAWKGVVRILAAATLFAGVLWLVSWRDHLLWPSQFGPAPLVGRLESDVEHPRFVVEEGPFVGTQLDFEAATGHPGATSGASLWEAVTILRPAAAPERIVLDAAATKELESQPAVGLKTTATRLMRTPSALVLSFILYVIAAMISFQRWQVLLKAVHVHARFWRVQKLGFLGLFFSNIIPGMTGGDVVKAIMVARDHPEQRPAAVLSVIVDRAIGLLGLALVASGALFFQHGHFEGMAHKLNLMLALIVVGGLMVMSRRVRRVVRLDRLVNALPFADVLKKLDRSALHYREARWQLAYAVLVSLVVHGMILTAIGVLGEALGIRIRFLDYYTLAPLALIAQSLPITPGGIGVGEVAFMYLFAKAGVLGPAAFALSLSYRAVQLVVSLIGGVLLLVKHEPPVSGQEMAESSLPGRDEVQADGPDAALV